MEYAVCAQLKVISADFLTSHILQSPAFLKIDMRSPATMLFFISSYSYSARLLVQITYYSHIVSCIGYSVIVSNITNMRFSLVELMVST